MTAKPTYADLAVTATHVIQEILTAFRCTVDLQMTLMPTCADCAATLLVVLAMMAMTAPRVDHVAALLLASITMIEPHVGRQLN